MKPETANQNKEFRYVYEPITSTETSKFTGEYKLLATPQSYILNIPSPDSYESDKQDAADKTYSIGPNEITVIFNILELNNTRIKANYVLKESYKNLDIQINHIEPYHFKIVIQSPVEVYAKFNFVKF